MNCRLRNSFPEHVLWQYVPLMIHSTRHCKTEPANEVSSTVWNTVINVDSSPLQTRILFVHMVNTEKPKRSTNLPCINRRYQGLLQQKLH